MRRIAAACPSRSCSASASRQSRPCATCRRAPTRGSRAKTARRSEWRVEAGDGVRRDLPDGRSVAERTIALPALPVGRHRLIVDGVECALTVAPAGSPQPEGARRASGSASPPSSTPCGARTRTAATRGSATSRRWRSPPRRPAPPGRPISASSPLHMLFPRDRDRASPYYPSDRRFLDPILIDALDGAGLPRDAAVDAALSRLAPAFAAAAATKTVEYEAVWRAKRTALEAWSAAFARARAARPGDPLIADYHAFARAGGEALRRFAAFQATAEGEAGENWRLWPQDLRDGEPQGDRQGDRAQSPGLRVRALLPVARRPPARARGRARRANAASRSDSTAISRSARRRTARSRGRMTRILARGVTIGAPPDPFSDPGAELEPAGAQSARRRARGLDVAQRALSRQHAPRRDAAHRSRDGACSACS